jgi:hypothetical protein
MREFFTHSANFSKDGVSAHQHERLLHSVAGDGNFQQ